MVGFSLLGWLVGLFLLVSPEKQSALDEAREDSSIDLGEGERDVRWWPEYNAREAESAE